MPKKVTDIGKTAETKLQKLIYRVKNPKLWIVSRVCSVITVLYDYGIIEPNKEKMNSKYSWDYSYESKKSKFKVVK